MPTELWFPADATDPRVAVIFDDVLPGWEVWIWLDHEHGKPIIHEVRIAPPRTHEGTPYRRATRGGLRAGDRNSVNLGTLGPRAFREVVTHTDELRESPQWEHWKSQVSVFETLDAAKHAVADPEFAGRRTITPLYLAQISAAYVRAVETETGRPYEQMSSEFYKSHSYLRDLVKLARRQGFLTKAPRGIAGGQLTKKSYRILDAHKEEKDGER